MKPNLIQFQPIDLARHMDICAQFREDSFRISFPENDEWRKRWNYAEYRSWLEKHVERFPEGALHLWCGEEIIGQLEFAYTDEWAHVNLFYLRPDKRGLGYGALLQRHVADFICLRGYSSATLRVTPSNERAIRFYLKHGWKDTGPDEQYPEVHLFRIDF
ncbi:GNAT family N-acetyltransferase [Saccharophagus sp. K07]|jgi:GNAT superfamily N-acetyltransferase|uniref:GNAT family N-acetyltransferase n=1 Tax=Saccharophagus sp. K07 TaxID=2283636 RepID=UPI00165214BA|nr:GNAT family N-acetyltransferase [Saccharophagus sp. K07]MBC6905344.1 GNAT family N-acetyltransferase [Saccharophagus sp. K07]